jgi:hypothetical protein
MFGNEKTMRTCWIGVVLLIVGVSTGCRSYEKYQNSKTGIFYPNRCGTVVCEKVHHILLMNDDLICTICQPVNISEFGIVTYSDPEYGSHVSREVARFDFSGNSVYIGTNTLNQFGRIEYRGPETLGTKISKMWSDFWSFLWNTLKLGFFLYILAIVLFIMGICALFSR